MQASLARMAEREPELAGRLLVSSLPAAAASIEGPLDYDLVLEGVGAYAVSIRDGKATVAELDGAPNADAEFTLLTDAGALARLAAGASPLGLMLRGRLRIRGNRLKALALRKLAGDLTMRDIARAGVTPEPGLVYRALPYAIDPQWTRGHRFSVVYRMQPDDTGDGGTWCVQVDDGTVTVAGEPPAASSRSRASCTPSRCSGAGSTAPKAETIASSSASIGSARCRRRASLGARA
jgi:hypothetical protein